MPTPGPRSFPQPRPVLFSLSVAFTRVVSLVPPPMSRVPTAWPTPLTSLTLLTPHFCHGPLHTNFRAPHCELYTHNFYTVSVNLCRIDLEALWGSLTYYQHSGVKMALSSPEQMVPPNGVPDGSIDPETGLSPYPAHVPLNTDVLCDFIEGSCSATLKSTSLILFSYYVQFCARSTCFLYRGVLQSHPARR